MRERDRAEEKWQFELKRDWDFGSGRLVFLPKIKTLEVGLESCSTSGNFTFCPGEKIGSLDSVSEKLRFLEVGIFFPTKWQQLKWKVWSVFLHQMELKMKRSSLQQELGDIRCLALEKVAESLELPCKYYSLGCPEIFPYYKLKHEALCNFRPYNCPYAGSECVVTGDIPYLVSHLRDDHKVDMHTGCTFNHRYVKSNPREVENATWMLTVFHCFGQYFCLHFEAFQLGMAPVYMAFLRFMGDESEARNYSYSLEVGGNGRKLIWEGTPRSIRDSHRKVRDSHDGQYETWHFSSLEVIERSLSSESLEEFGRNSRTQMLGCAYQIFVTKKGSFGINFFVFLRGCLYL
ncbi:UNVERIFIED_CONTAM: E3 ubiquitin-protein ligase SINAT3 [Sesamum latifolium]|uniref:RING-type E3 ubiquitin transferase n=1 Tax=Sesamum latifolium TaxID=2727402 RepID=A0AAW2T6T7_9LAMI